MKPPSRLLALLAGAILTACGGGTGSTPGASHLGTVHLSLADSPACGYDQVAVTITRVRLNQSATAGDTDAGWVDLDVAAPARTDLLTLTNGVMQDLGLTTLAPGRYTQMRLILAANGTSAPYANAVVPTGSAEAPLTTPSAQTSGLKANIDLTVNADQTADAVVDFDACRSVVAAGRSGRYLLKPVIDVTPMLLSGAKGWVDVALAAAGARVSLQQHGREVKATTPDLTGQFTLAPVAPGSYDLVITAPGHAAAVVTGVTVPTQSLAMIDASNDPVSLDVDVPGTAAGLVTTTASPIAVGLSATQTLANGDIVEIGAANADADTGAYALSLPSVAPKVAAWPASGALVFAPDTTAGHACTLSASDGTNTKSAGPISITAGATVTTNFAF